MNSPISHFSRTGAIVLLVAACGFTPGKLQAQASEPSAEQLARWLKRFPDADTNEDGLLSLAEAEAYRKKMLGGQGGRSGGGAPREFKVDPGWDEQGFPEHAVSHRSPEEIMEIYTKTLKDKGPAVKSFEMPADGALRIIGTGHSFMAPGYRTLPAIVRAAGFEDQPLYTHTGGGITGSTRYKWEQENGIFQFDKKPVPKLLASIANAEWDVMTWGPYFNDRPKYYSCWVDYCLKYQPEMKFYLSDAWLQLHQLGENPKSEAFFTDEVLDRLGEEKREIYAKLLKPLREAYPGKIFIMPTCDAMTLAAKAQIRGELPGVEGIHQVIGGKERSLWKDQLGHIGPGFDRLEGYVFYATLYGKSPALIEGDIDFSPQGRGQGGSDFPGRELDRKFRQIAWEAVTNHPLSGVTDRDGDGLGDGKGE